jgi:transposase
MFSLNGSQKYFLYRPVTDMRKSFDGLSGLVQGRLERNPMSGEVFIFINRRRDKVKLLRWEPGGFILYYKRLESGTLELPALDKNTLSCEMAWSQLMMMIEGIPYQNIKRRKRYLLTTG